MTSWLASSSPGRAVRVRLALAMHIMLFLYKTLNLTPTGEFNAEGKPAMDQHTNQGGVKMLSVASFY